MFDKFVMGDPLAAKDGWPTAIALEAAAAVVRTWPILEGCVVEKFGVFITVTLNYDTKVTDTIIKLRKRVTPGSDVSAVDLATITLVNGWAALKSYFVKVDNTLNYAKCNRGQELVAVITQAGTGGGAIAGDFQPFWTGHPADEAAGNLNAYMVDVTPTS